MLYYDRIDLSEDTDVAKSNNSKKCIVCQYWFFNHGLNFQNSVCKCCHELMMLCLNIAILLLSLLKVFIIVVIFMTLANLKQLIC